ncbi:MAG: hypothetical protein LQ340_000977 [Diploschistes diacapsis]|nr:MAG: hypothetical protein LQ340_000977 [Diploschistes diacapsis]
MAVHRGKHHVQNSIVSDYESDVHYLSDIPPPPPERTDEELNLSVLRRYNRDVRTLEYVAPYVVVYNFVPDTLSWEKSGIEGSTFLCALQPNREYGYRCAVTVLNRRSPENLNIEIRSRETVEISEEYIILKNEAHGDAQIHGLWVFREPPPSSTAHHPEEFAKKVQECAEKVELSHRRVPLGRDSEEEKGESAPMGRQISLSQLFGQQRQEDDSWSIRSHSPSRPPAQPFQQTAPPLASHFTNTADTDFFRAGVRPTAAPSPAVSAQSNGQRETLLELFHKLSETRPI